MTSREVDGAIYRFNCHINKVVTSSNLCFKNDCNRLQEYEIDYSNQYLSKDLHATNVSHVREFKKTTRG